MTVIRNSYTGKMVDLGRDLIELYSETVYESGRRVPSWAFKDSLKPSTEPSFPADEWFEVEAFGGVDIDNYVEIGRRWYPYEYNPHVDKLAVEGRRVSPRAEEILAAVELESGIEYGIFMKDAILSDKETNNIQRISNYNGKIILKSDLMNNGGYVDSDDISREDMLATINEFTSRGYRFEEISRDGKPGVPALNAPHTFDRYSGVKFKQREWSDVLAENKDIKIEKFVSKRGYKMNRLTIDGKERELTDKELDNGFYLYTEYVPKVPVHGYREGSNV